MKFVYAGDRQVSVEVLRFLIETGFQPDLLCVSSPKKQSHAADLRDLCNTLTDDQVAQGVKFRKEPFLSRVKELQPDFIVGVHFPYIIPEEVLEIPKHGVINLHPAYLPYNRGWNTPSWAILDGTPYGATLHYMDKDIDTGPIIHQLPLDVRPDDTAHSLYQRVLKLEVDVFNEAWPRLVRNEIASQVQDPSAGTTHVAADLGESGIKELDLNETMSVRDLLTRLRGLTTSELKDAAYFAQDGVNYRVQVKITPGDEST